MHEGLTTEVLSRLVDTPDPRLREVMIALVRHLHAFAREVHLTEREWLRGIQFLTDVGHITDEHRQEFILLSDTLGLSSLVVDLTHGDDEHQHGTAATILGPFYVSESPTRSLGDSIAEQDSGEPIVVTGTVRSTDGAPIPGAEVDVWQTSSNGLYDVQDPQQPEGNLRGRFITDAQGRYTFKSVRPVSYPIPDDGPVGRLLRDTGRHPWRAAHIHFIVSAPGHTTVTTHIFDSENEYLDSDTVFGVKDSLVRTIQHVDSVTAPGIATSDDLHLLLENDVVLKRVG